MSKNRHFQIILFIVYSAVAVLAAWLVLRYLIPWFAPFILAFITAAFIEPIIKYCTDNLGCKRHFISVICSLLVLFSFTGVFVLIISRSIYEITAFAKELPSALSGMPDIYAKFDEKIYNYITAAPIDVQNYLKSTIDNVLAGLSELPLKLSTKLLDFVSSAIAAAPKIILFIVTYAIGVIFISISFPDIKSYIIRQIPYRFHAKLRELKNGLVSTLGLWLRAELIIMLITFIELTIFFTLVGVDYAILLGALTAIVDALPVLGVGTVLIPWALFELILGNRRFAFSLIIIYCAAVVIRSFLEPKIVGSHIGLSPVVTLIAVYVGYACMGVFGMIFFPIAIILFKQFNDLGYINILK